MVLARATSWRLSGTVSCWAKTSPAAKRTIRNDAVFFTTMHLGFFCYRRIVAFNFSAWLATLCGTRRQGQVLKRLAVGNWQLAGAKTTPYRSLHGWHGFAPIQLTCFQLKRYGDRTRTAGMPRLPQESKLTSSGSSEPCLLAGRRCGRRSEWGKISSSSCRPFLTEITAEAAFVGGTWKRGRSVCWQSPIFLTTDRLTRQQDQLA